MIHSALSLIVANTHLFLENYSEDHQIIYWAQDRAAPLLRLFEMYVRHREESALKFLTVSIHKSTEINNMNNTETSSDLLRGSGPLKRVTITDSTQFPLRTA